MPDARPLRPGDPARLGSYELTGRLGEGGQGVVFLGRGPSGERVAIKLLRADLAQNAAARDRFLRELTAVRRVARFCTAQVLEADVEGDRPYIVSEYVPGPSLDALVRSEGPRSGADLERLAIGTVTALVAIHQAGLVHRDFKPQNVLIGPDGPRVIDFGIAKALDVAGTGTATATNTAIGTPAYMAPEQLSGREITRAADIFAWGSTMVFAATGRSPFGQDTVMAVINRIMSEPPDLGGLAEPLRGIVARCLAKEPADRPTAQELLMRLLGEEGVTPVVPTVGVAPTAIMGQGAAFADTMTVGRGGTRPNVPVTVPAPMPRKAAGGGLSGRTLLAAITGLLVVVGAAAAIMWAISRGVHQPQPGPVFTPVPSSSPSTIESPTEPTRPSETSGPPSSSQEPSTQPETSPPPTTPPTPPTSPPTTPPTPEPTGGTTKPTGGSTQTGANSNAPGAPTRAPRAPGPEPS